MTAPPDLVAAVIGRLDGLAELVSAEDALALSELVERKALPHRTPAAYVLSIGEDAAGNALAAGGHRQLVTERIGVVLVVRAAEDATGSQRRQRLEPVIRAVRGVLTGWTPDPAVTPLDYARGRLLGTPAGAAIHQLDFAAEWHLTGGQT